MHDQEGGGSFVTSQRPVAVYHFKSTAASATARPPHSPDFLIPRDSISSSIDHSGHIRFLGELSIFDDKNQQDRVWTSFDAAPVLIHVV